MEFKSLSAMPLTMYGLFFLVIGILLTQGGTLLQYKGVIGIILLLFAASLVRKGMISSKSLSDLKGIATLIVFIGLAGYGLNFVFGIFGIPLPVISMLSEDWMVIFGFVLLGLAAIKVGGD